METKFLVRESFPFQWYLYKPLSGENNDSAAIADIEGGISGPDGLAGSGTKRETSLPSLIALRLFWYAVTTVCNSEPYIHGYGDDYLDLYTFSLNDFRSHFESDRIPEGRQKKISGPAIRKSIIELRNTRIVNSYDGDSFHAFGAKDGSEDDIWIPSEDLNLDLTKPKKGEEAVFRRNNVYFTSEFISLEGMFFPPETAAEDPELGFIMDFKFIAAAPSKNRRDILTYAPLYLALEKQLNRTGRNVGTSSFSLMTIDGYTIKAPDNPELLKYTFSEFKSAVLKPAWKALNDLIEYDIHFDDFPASRKNHRKRCVLFHHGEWDEEEVKDMAARIPSDLYD